MMSLVGVAGAGCEHMFIHWPFRLGLWFFCRSFIIDGVITLPIALYGFLVFPDVPTTTRAFYLTEEVSESARS